MTIILWLLFTSALIIINFILYGPLFLNHVQQLPEFSARYSIWLIAGLIFIPCFILPSFVSYCYLKIRKTKPKIFRAWIVTLILFNLTYSGAYIFGIKPLDYKLLENNSVRLYSHLTSNSEDRAMNGGRIPEPQLHPSDKTSNHPVIRFVDAAMSKTIGRGECWDLAQQALDETQARWTRPFDFGRLIDPDKETAMPGDIIQFASVRIENGGSWMEIGMPSHTAVIYRVLDQKIFELAHQNFSGIRKVRRDRVNLNHVVRGTYQIYRPVF